MVLSYKGFPGGSDGKEYACNVGNLGLIPGLGRSPGEEKGYPLQYSGLQNSMDSIVHGVTNSQTQLCDFHFHFSFSLLSAMRVVSSAYLRLLTFLLAMLTPACASSALAFHLVLCILVK